MACIVSAQVSEYKFHYDIEDEFGNRQSRTESRDAEGTVSGTFLYRLITGIFRTARYKADKNGFRIIIDSNEPGMSRQNPADVLVRLVDPPPGAYNSRRRTWISRYFQNNHKFCFGHLISLETFQKLEFLLLYPTKSRTA